MDSINRMANKIIEEMKEIHKENIRNSYQELMITVKKMQSRNLRSQISTRRY